MIHRLFLFLGVKKKKTVPITTSEALVQRRFQCVEYTKKKIIQELSVACAHVYIYLCVWIMILIIIIFFSVCVLV